MQSRFSRQFCWWSSETTWFQSFGNLLYQSRLWRISKRASRLHEELAQRERVLRETQIRSLHEVEELKRAQEMRIIDEFSRTNWENVTPQYRSSLQKCRSCRKEWITWTISENFQDRDSRSQSTGSRSKSSSYKACDLIHGICLGHRETFWAIHVQ